MVWAVLEWIVAGWSVFESLGDQCVRLFSCNARESGASGPIQCVSSLPPLASPRGRTDEHLIHEYAKRPPIRSHIVSFV